MTTAWQDSAACKGMDPDTFFPGQGGDVRLPKSICATCPVSAQCLDAALVCRDTVGIWAGTGERERRRMRRSRPKTTWLDRANCGTIPGYKKHLHEGTPTCEPCRRANALSKQLNKERQSA